LISAAETSSDLHGAALLRALQARSPAKVEAFGIAGPALEAQGCEVIVDARELLAMGFSEVLGRMPKIVSALKKIEAAALERKPDLAVVIDYPEFHFRLGARLKKLGIPVVYLIPPKVWVWRKSRVRILRERFVKILSILPFEVPFYQAENVPVTYIGNPLLDQLPWKQTRETARNHLGLETNQKTLLLMIGSRASELKWHLEPMLGAAVQTAAHLRSQGILGPKERLRVLIPLAKTTEFEVQRERILKWLRQGGWHSDSSILQVDILSGESHLAMLASDFGVVKSGTSTLEAALLGLPHIVVYQANRLSRFLFKYLVRYRDPVGLVNLILRDSNGLPVRIVPELLAENCTSELISSHLVAWFKSQGGASQELKKIRSRLVELKEAMTRGVWPESPSERAADEVIRVWESRRN
jgi:lipid-A-disaccharide synthase